MTGRRLVCCVAVIGQRNDLRSWTCFLEVRGSTVVFRGRPLCPSGGSDDFNLRILATILIPDVCLQSPFFRTLPMSSPGHPGFLTFFYSAVVMVLSSLGAVLARVSIFPPFLTPVCSGVCDMVAADLLFRLASYRKLSFSTSKGVSSVLKPSFSQFVTGSFRKGPVFTAFRY